MISKLRIILGASLCITCTVFIYSLSLVSKDMENSQLKVSSSHIPSLMKQDRTLPPPISDLEPSVGTATTSALSSKISPDPTPLQDSYSPTPDLPILYQVDRGKFPSLPPGQQGIIISLNYEYLQFYQSWNNTYPHDIDSWNKEMEILRSEFAQALGNSASDVLQ